MPSLLIALTISSLVIVLRFDGSLRPPPDLDGFTRAPVAWTHASAKPLDGSATLASCGATISLHAPDDPDGREEGELVAAGAKHVPNFPGMTSADAEYEGLLFGLERLLRAFSADLSDDSDAWAWHEPAGTDGPPPEPPRIILRGDCKAVIDQLSSRSVPRKTAAQHQLAMDQMRALQDAHAAQQRRRSRRSSKGVPSPAPRELSFGFEHVPREENVLCDALCQVAIHRKQTEIVTAIRALIKAGEEEALELVHNGAINRRMKQAKRRREGGMKSDYFWKALDSVLNHPQLCHSSRLALACQLTDVALRREDAALLRHMSDFFTQVSRRWSRIYHLEDMRAFAGADTLRDVGAACEALSWHFSGAVLEAPRCSHNIDVCRRGVAAVLDFCTPRGSDDGGEDAGSPEDAVARPLEDLAATPSGKGAESRRWRWLLGRWNAAAAEDRAQHLDGEGRGVWINVSRRADIRARIVPPAYRQS